MHRTAIPITLPLLILLAGCGGSTEPQDQPFEISDSFESGLSTWVIRSLDTEVDTLTIDWHVVTTDTMSSAGSASAELYMDNLTDAAKVWLETTLSATPNNSYLATISFDFASSDAGDVNNFQLLANVLSQKPETRQDVLKGVGEGDFPEGTYNGGEDGYVWLAKSIQKEITAEADGTIYFILGIWGTWEGPRTYYFDNLSVSLAAE